MATVTLSLDLDNTFGAYLIGTFFSAILLGVTCVQVFQYFKNYTDRYLIKLTVIVLLVLELLHSAFSMHAIYWFVITNFAKPFSLLKSTWSATINLGILGLVILVVQLSYARRIYHVNGKKKLVPILVAILAVVHVGFSWSVVGSALHVVYFTSFPGLTENLAKAALCLAVVIDILIAGLLSYYLHKSRTGIKNTDTLINRLMIYTINNGILTSVTDVICLAFVISHPDDFLYLAITQVLGNLYTNSLLATLNSRRTLNSKLGTHVAGNGGNAGSSFQLSAVQFGGGSTIPTAVESRHTNDKHHEDYMTRTETVTTSEWSRSKERQDMV